MVMYLRFCILIFGVLISVGIREIHAQEKSPTSATKSTSRLTTSKDNDIYIDDDALEGSGNQEVKDDLESSGSGYGPDDEDGDGSADVRQPIKETNTKTVSGTDDKAKTRVLDVAEGGNKIDGSKSSGGSSGSGSGSGSSSSGSGGGSHRENDDDTPDLPPVDNDLPGQTHHAVPGVTIDTKSEERTASFFAQPGILAAVIGGAVVGLLCAILVVMFIVYRMRKKDEGSYPLDEPKRLPNQEFYA